MRVITELSKLQFVIDAQFVTAAFCLLNQLMLPELKARMLALFVLFSFKAF